MPERAMEETAAAVKRPMRSPEPAPHTHAPAPGAVWDAAGARTPGAPSAVLAIQRTAGNQAVMRMLDARRPGHPLAGPSTAVQRSSEVELDDDVQAIREGELDDDVQRDSAALHEPSDAAIRSAAAEGVRTPSTTLPYLDRIQASFGRHYIGHIQAHVGEGAARASQAMNALAYASGDHVVFGTTPDLRTAAHEAAHVVQQQAGVQLFGGIGRAGDSYERQADAVADAVVGGRLAEEVLNCSLSQTSTIMAWSRQAAVPVGAVRTAKRPDHIQCKGATGRGMQPSGYPEMLPPTEENWHMDMSGPYRVPTEMEVWLTPNWGKVAGGPPVNTSLYADVAARRNEEGHAYYDRGHVLAESLKGPAQEFNMVPLPRAVNLRMRDEVENKILSYIKDGESGVLKYTVRIMYGHPPGENRGVAELYLPNALHFSAKEYYAPLESSKWRDLHAWSDPVPADNPVQITDEIPVNLNFQEPFPGNGLSASPYLKAISEAEARLKGADEEVKGIVADLENRGLSGGPITTHWHQFRASLGGEGYGFAVQNQSHPVILLQNFDARLRAEREKIHEMQALLIKTVDATQHNDADELDKDPPFLISQGNAIDLQKDSMELEDTESSLNSNDFAKIDAQLKQKAREEGRDEIEKTMQKESGELNKMIYNAYRNSKEESQILEIQADAQAKLKGIFDEYEYEIEYGDGSVKTVKEFVKLFADKVRDFVNTYCNELDLC